MKVTINSHQYFLISIFLHCLFVEKMFSLHFAEDLCKSGLILCGPNAICAVINEITNAQGCVCKDGFRAYADIKERGCFGQ